MFVSSVASGAGHVDDDAVGIDSRIQLARHDREGAEQEIAGVGHDGGPARSDFVAGFEFEKLAESPVDVEGGMEFFGVANEESGEVGLLELRLVAGGVIRAEARLRIEEGLAQRRPLG